MDLEKSKNQYKKSSSFSESIQTELPRRTYHLRTLYDLSRNIFGIVESETILKKFLLMTTGNFGVIEGFILIQDILSKKITHMETVGFRDDERASLSESGKQLFLKEWDEDQTVLYGSEIEGFDIIERTIECIVRFKLDESCSCLLGLGSKLAGEPYSKDDEELLVTLVNNLIVALGNARAFEDTKRLNLAVQNKNVQLEKTIDDLDKRVYHLKTLYDASKDIFGLVDFEIILKNFLAMTMGNFGIIEGFILTLEVSTGEIIHFQSMGYRENSQSSLREWARQFLLSEQEVSPIEKGSVVTTPGKLLPNLSCALPFVVMSDFSSLLGLGPKIVGESFNEDDGELLITLVNNLVVALRNARSFEEIKQLNLDLKEKNVQLEKALKELQAALRKVEILESVKANLSKFVPTTVTKFIEKSPTAPIPEAKDQDVSVLFLDIEGYTHLSERLDDAELNELVEKYFSVFMEAIYANNGDINETSGDGLMVLFLGDDEKTNALEAVRTALMIRQKAALVNREDKSVSESLVINMGINSGHALLGAAKFESYTGSRWTYTARGMVTNVAARIGALASSGTILLSRATADRVKALFAIEPLGKFSLKNVSEEVEIFEVRE